MTPERKIFLASISKEERIIRNTINAIECGISIDKQSMAFNINKLGHKKSIEKLKTILKVLKKQIPMCLAKRYLYIGKVKQTLGICPTCRNVIEITDSHFCIECGQKLR